MLKDPGEVSSKWTCNLNPDVQYSSCLIPQDSEYDSSQYVYSDFVVGTIKWVHLQSFPAWPAIIDDNPDTRTSIWISDADRKDNMQMTKCHVVFFDSLNGTVTRSWIDTSCMHPFKGNETMKKFTNLDEDTYENLTNALQSAKKAAKMTLQQRRKMYCTLYQRKYKNCL